MRSFPQKVSAAIHADSDPSLEFLTRRLPLWFIGSAVVGLAIKQSSLLATIHALGTLLIVIYWASKRQYAWRATLGLAYIAAAEVIWRMCHASVNYEYGKYSVALIVLILLSKDPPKRLNLAAISYFGFLLPSCLLTLQYFVGDLDLLRKETSFNISGPFALSLSVIYFTGRAYSKAKITQLLIVILGALVSTASICTFSTYQLGSTYEFTTNSNFDTTGGFGPNQVSSALGLGVLSAFLLGQFWKKRSIVSVILSCMVSLYFLAQAALTFSRTGVWVGIGCVVVVILFTTQDFGKLIPMLFGAAILCVLAYFFVIPALDRFTGGKLTERFHQEGFTGREEIARLDLEIALEHPVMGVGLGVSKFARANALDAGVAAHTEFTRLLAEHGCLGALSILAMFWMAGSALLRAKDPLSRAWSAGLCVYAFLFMTCSGMRLVAPSFAMGLASISIVSIPARDRRRLPKSLNQYPHPTK